MTAEPVVVRPYEANWPAKYEAGDSRCTTCFAVRGASRAQGGDFWRRHILFRDHLRKHPDVAVRYFALKRRFAAVHRHDRRAYLEGKSAFIEAVLAVAGAGVRTDRFSTDCKEAAGP